MDIDGNAPVNPVATETDSTEPQFVTTEQLNQLSEKMLGDVKAMIGRVPHMVQEHVQQSQPKIQDAPVSKGLQDQKSIDPEETVARLLKTEREALAKEKSAIERQRIRGTLEQELINNGANPQAVKLATDSLMVRNDGKLLIESNDLGESSVKFKPDEYSEPLTVGDFVRGFLESSEGMSVVQPKKSPSGRGIPNSNSKIVGEVVKMTRAEASTADPKLLLSGRVMFTD